MSLYQTIKTDQLTSRKARDAVRTALLTTLLGEAAMAGKNDGNRESTDVEVVAMVKKFIKSNETIPAAARTEIHDAERAILLSYLPAQLTEEQLKSIISTSLKLNMAMGEIMQAFKTGYIGQYDAALVSKLIKEAKI